MRWLALALLCLAGFAHAAPPVVQLNATNISGNAPLYVFFDVDGTTQAGNSAPLTTLHYCWDAGDGNTERYTLARDVSAVDSGGTTPPLVTGLFTKTMAKAQRCGIGDHVFSYVYETPGTYDARVTATNAAGEALTKTVQITVGSYTGAQTACIHPTVEPTPGADGCPSGAIGIANSSITGGYSACRAAGRIRCLFRAGQNFTGGEVDITTNGIHVGGYDASGVITSYRAKFNVTTHTGTLFDIAAVDDVRVTDFDWPGGTTAYPVQIANSQGAGYASNILYQNAYIAVQNQFNSNANDNNDNDFPFAVGIFHVSSPDCGNGGNNCIFSSIEKLSVVDSYLYDATDGEHIIRLQYGFYADIHANYLGYPDIAKHTLTLRSLDSDGRTGGITDAVGRSVVVTDNYMICTTNTCAEIGQTNFTTGLTTHRNYTVNRNLLYFVDGSYGQVQNFVNALKPASSEDRLNLTMCNNIFQLRDSNVTTGQPINGNWPGRSLYCNNSAYLRGDAKMFRFAGSSVEAYGNLQHNDDNSGVMFVDGTPGTSANNWSPSGDAASSALTGSPFLVSAPLEDVDFALNPGGSDYGSLLNGSSNAVPVRCDYFSVGRETPDVGAIEVDTASDLCTLQEAAPLPPAPPVATGLVITLQ